MYSRRCANFSPQSRKISRQLETELTRLYTVEYGYDVSTS